jgi:signal transduction histidine kinase
VGASAYLRLLAIISLALLAELTRIASAAQAEANDQGLAIELVVLAVIAQHFPLAVGPQHKIDTSIAVYFACVLLFDTPEAVVLVGLAQVLGQSTLALRHVPGTNKRMRGARGILFNTSQLVLATTLGGLTYNAFLPHTGPAPLERLENLWALPAAALAMHLTNSVLVAAMVGIQLRHSPREVLLSVWHSAGLERAALFLVGLVAALAGGRYPGAPIVMAVPAGILFLSQRRALSLLAREQYARAEAERARGHLSLLANASATLAASLDYQTTLQSAVSLATPTLADWCSISISVGLGDAAYRWSSGASVDLTRADCLASALRHSSSGPDIEDTSRSELYPSVSEELIADHAPDSACAKLLHDLGSVSAMLVPLRARGETLGTLALFAIGSGRTYGPADLVIAEDLAQRIALAIDNARLYEEQQQIVGRLQQLRGRLEESERVKLIDDERERIARELHDRVEQAFFGIGLGVNALLAGPPTSTVESLYPALVALRSSAGQGAEDLRAAIFALTRAEVHDLGLVQALWQLVRDFQKRTGLEADLVESGAERRALPEIAEVLHAVAREGLANVEQHARASAVVVSLRFEPEAVTLTVQDDGIGASSLVMSTLSDSATRFGLSGIRERVLRLGGTFTAQSGDEGGFIIRAHVGLTPAEPGAHDQYPSAPAGYH